MMTLGKYNYTNRTLFVKEIHVRFWISSFLGGLLLTVMRL